MSSARLPSAPELCLRLGEVDGALWWIPDEQMDLSQHVVAREVPEPCDRAGLQAQVAQLFEQRLDRSRPLWRIDVIPHLASGGSALIWRIHHALADGWSSVRVARQALWDDDPSELPRPLRCPRGCPPDQPAGPPAPGLAAPPRARRPSRGVAPHSRATSVPGARWRSRPWPRHAAPGGPPQRRGHGQ